MAYLLDTDWAIWALRGRREVTERVKALRGEELAISAATLAELTTGVHRSTDPKKADDGLHAFLARVRVLPLTAEIARRFGEENARLLASGQAISQFDLAIAATALVHDLTLLTGNRKHFERISGLKLESLKAEA